MNDPIPELNRMRNRQVARLLSRLGNIDQEQEKTIKRSYSMFADDVAAMFTGTRRVYGKEIVHPLQ